MRPNSPILSPDSPCHREDFGEILAGLFPAYAALIPRPLEVFYDFVGEQDLLSGNPSAGALSAAAYRTIKAGLKGGSLPGSEKLLLLAYAALCAGRPGSAQSAISRACRNDPRDPRAALLSAAALWVRGDTERSRRWLLQARRAADRAVELGGPTRAALLLRAQIRFEFEDNEAGLSDLDVLLARRPDDVSVRVGRAEILADLYRYRPALRELGLVFKAVPSAWWVYAQRARLKGMCGRLKGALNDFAFALRARPDVGALWAWRAEVLRRLGRSEESLADLDRAIKLDGGYAFGWELRGRLRLTRGEVASALSDLDRACGLDATHRMAFLWRGEARFKSGQLALAWRDWDRVYPLDPRTAWNPAGQRSGRGLSAEKERAFWRDVDEAVCRLPGDPWAWCLRGRFKACAGLAREALPDLTRALQLARSGNDSSISAFALGWRGKALLDLGANSKAASDLNRAVLLAPRNGVMRSWKASALLRLGREKEALEEFDRALRRPEAPLAAAFLERARTLAGLGEWNLARDDFEMVLALDAKRGEAREGLARALLHRVRDFDDWIRTLPDLLRPAVGLGLHDPRIRSSLEGERLSQLERELINRAGLKEIPLGLALSGRIKRLRGQPGAARDLERALRRDPTCAAARLWRAEMLLERRPGLALKLLSGMSSAPAALYQGVALCRLKRWKEAAVVLAQAGRLDRSASLPPLLEGLALAKVRDLRGALRAYGEAGRRKLDTAALHWLKAIALGALGNEKGAASSIERAFERHSEADPMDVLLGEALVDKVMRAPRRALALAGANPSKPRMAWALANRSQIRSLPHVQDTRGVVADLRRAVALQPSSAWLWAYLGRGLKNIGEKREALRCLDRAVTLAPESGWIRAWRGENRRLYGDARALRDLRKAVTLSPEYPFGHAWLGNALRSVGRLEEAALALQMSHRLEPGYEWSLAELFKVRKEQGRWREACRLLTSAYERDPKFAWSSSTGVSDRRRALGELARAVRSTPHEIDLLAWRAKLSLESGETSAARDLGAAKSPRTAFSHHVLASWEERRGRMEEALGHHDRAVALKRAGPYLGERGVLLCSMGLFRRAVRDLQAAARLNDTTARYLYFLGVAYRGLGRWDQASKSLERAVGICPDFPQAQALRSELAAR